MTTRSTSRSSKPNARPKTFAAAAKSYGLVAAMLLALPLIYLALLTYPKSDAQPVASSATNRAESESDRCVDCHAEIAARYAQNGMSHTWQPVSNGCAGDFSLTTPVVDSHTHYEYLLHKKGNTVSQIERLAEGPGHALERLAAFTVGSGKHAQAMVANENGYLTQMPVAWYTGRHAWGLNPGFELRNQRFDRPIVPGCVACHSSGAQHDYPTKNRFHDRTISGIHCNRCHGDPTAHVNYWRKNKSGPGGFDGDVINPATFTPSQANDLCLQCHLQGDVVVFLKESDPLKFHPGQRLRDQRHDFLIATEDNSRLGVASHGARMLQSKCYSASDGKLTCVLCHDPHRSAIDTTRQEYDARCNTCHKPDACSRSPQLDTAKPATSSCTDCHMPQRSSREGIHLVFTDHAIVKNGVAPQDIEPALLGPNTDPSLASCWPGETVPASVLGAAYQLLHESMGPQRPSSERAIALLNQAIAQQPGEVDSQFWLGSALLATGNGSEAILHLENVLKAEHKRHLARFRLGLAQEQAGRIEEARLNYEQLLSETPHWIEPYPRLAQIYLSRQQHQPGIRILQQQLSQCEDAQAYATLGLAYGLAGGPTSQALGWIDRSIQLNPRSASAHLHRAVLLLMDGKNALAELELERVLEIDPQNAQARQAMDQLKK